MIKDINIYFSPLNISFLLILLLPLSLVSGPFIPDLFISIISFLVIFLFFKSEYKKYFYNKFTFFFIIFYLYLLILSFTSKNILLSLSSSLFYFRFFLFAISIWIVFDNFKIKYFFYSILIPLLILFVDGTYQYLYGYNLIGFHLSQPDRVSSFFGKELKMGSFVVRFLPIIIAIFLTIHNNNKNLIYINFIILISFFIVIISGERTALAMSLLIITYMVYFSTLYFRLNFYLIIPLIILFILMIYLDYNIFFRFILKTLNQFNFLSDNFDLMNLNILSEHHQDIYKAAFNIFLDNQIFGIGPKMFRIECSSYISNLDPCTTHPHNFYLQTLSETGLIGFFFISFFYCYLLVSFFKIFINKKHNLNIIYSFALLSLLVQLFPLFPSGNFFNNWLCIIMFYSLGLFFYGKRYVK